MWGQRACPHDAAKPPVDCRRSIMAQSSIIGVKVTRICANALRSAGERSLRSEMAPTVFWRKGVWRMALTPTSSSDRTRKIVVAGVLGAISALLGWTRLGFIPWFSGAALTIMHVPVIIGAVLEGPWVGAAVGLIFGAFSMLQAAIAPTGPTDVWFTNPLLAIVPRLAIGPVAWLVYLLMERRPRWSIVAAVIVGPLFVVAMVQILGYQLWVALLLVLIENVLLVLLGWQIVSERAETAFVGAGIAGSLTNTILVLGMIGILGLLPWQALPAIALVNGLPEAVASAILTLVVVAAWKRIQIGSRRGARL